MPLQRPCSGCFCQPTHVYTSLHINAGLCPQQTAQPEDCFLCPCRGHALAAAASQHMCTPLLTSNAGLCLQQTAQPEDSSLCPCRGRALAASASQHAPVHGRSEHDDKSHQCASGHGGGHGIRHGIRLADDGRCLLFAWLLWVAVALFC